jgi:hypothetical protein
LLRKAAAFWRVASNQDGHIYRPNLSKRQLKLDLQRRRQDSQTVERRP